MNTDATFFRGRFLIKDKTSAAELKQNLVGVLSQKGKPKEEWDPEIGVWFFDYFFKVPLMKSELEEIRVSIIESVRENESETFLNGDTIRLVEAAIVKLES